MASKTQTKVIKLYESKGYYVINLTRTNKNGIADLLCLKAGEKPMFVECKESNDNVKVLQSYRGREVEKYGCEFMVIKSTI
jgi:hypothetical protein